MGGIEAAEAIAPPASPAAPPPEFVPATVAPPVLTLLLTPLWPALHGSATAADVNSAGKSGSVISGGIVADAEGVGTAVWQEENEDDEAATAVV